MIRFIILGGVLTEFERVIEFLKRDEKYKIYKINEEKYEEPIDKKINVFTFIEDKIENKAFPIIFKKFSSYFIKEEDLEKFKRFLIIIYYDELKSHNIINLLNPRIKIPYYFYSKIFTRIYTMEASFYKDLNLALSNNNILDLKSLYLLYIMV